MSKSQAIAFFEEISKNNKLAKEVEKVVGGKKSDEAKAKELISLAKKYNFNFTQKEAASAQSSLKKSLSPEEMLEVSGGKCGLKSSFMAMALLAGLGVGGAAMFSTEASAKEGGQQQEIQVPGGQAGADRQEGNAQPEQQEGADPAATQQQENAEQPLVVRSGTVVQDGAGDTVVHGGGRTFIEGRGAVDVSGDGALVSVNGEREVFIGGDVKSSVLVAGARPTLVFGAGAAWINRPGGREPGQAAEIFVAAARQLTPEQLQQMNPGLDPHQQPRVCLPRDVRVNDGGLVEINNAQQTNINTINPVTHTAPGGSIRVTGNALVTTEGVNHITAGGDSHILSFSRHEIEQQGLGGVRIDPVGDAADIVVGGTFPTSLFGRNVTIEKSNAVTVNGAFSLAINADCIGGLTVSSDAAINARGANRIIADAKTYVNSTSSHLLTHAGAGAVVIDGGAISTSDTSLEQLERDVTVTSANSVTVNPGITICTQNGNEFTMGATRDETIESLIPDQQELSLEFRRRHRRNQTVDNARLQNFLAWTMEHFDISPSELRDFLDKSFVLPHLK